MQISAQAYPHMAAAGWIFEKNSARAEGVEIRDAMRNTKALDRIEGRLENIAYMAQAIDMFDVGASKLPVDWQGKKQFQYLMERENLVYTGLIYVALRRFQREGRQGALRAGLALLFAVEDGMITGRDAVSGMAPDLLTQVDNKIADNSSTVKLIER